MELVCSEKNIPQENNSLKKNKEVFIVTSCNWDIENNKPLDDCISTVLLSQAPNRTNLEDVVSLDTCVALKSDSSKDSCKIEFKVTNKQKIAYITVVSEASVLEFFKQSGEYANTVFADYVDEFEDQAVYFAETKIEPPSTEASIKFTRTKNKGSAMWIYGIKLTLTELNSENSKSMFDFDVINSFLSNSNQVRPEMARKVLESFTANESNSISNDMNSCLQKLTRINWNSNKSQANNKTSEVNEINSSTLNKSIENKNDFTNQNITGLETHINNIFDNLEKRLMERLKLIDKNTNDKVDQNITDLKTYIDNKFDNLEKRLMERLKLIDENTDKFDRIVKRLESSNVNNQ